MPPLPPHPPRSRRGRRAVSGAFVALAALAAAAAAGCGADGERAIVERFAAQTAPAPTPPRATAPSPSPPAPAPATAAAPAPAPAAPARTARPRPAPQPVVHVTRATALRARPGGPVVARLPARTAFDSPTVVPVVRRSGRWLGVVSDRLPNGRIGWISARARLQGHRSAWRIDVSLRRREVVARRAGRVAARFPVAIGSPSTPTPRGRFAVTDKLLTEDPGSPYGCCILALSGHQPSTPQGWGGGDRIAIHATNLPQTIGTEASIGCLRAPTAAIRRLVETVPLGTVVTIRA